VRGLGQGRGRGEERRAAGRRGRRRARHGRAGAPPRVLPPRPRGAKRPHPRPPPPTQGIRLGRVALRRDAAGGIEGGELELTTGAGPAQVLDLSPEGGVQDAFALVDAGGQLEVAGKVARRFLGKRRAGAGAAAGGEGARAAEAETKRRREEARRRETAPGPGLSIEDDDGAAFSLGAASNMFAQKDWFKRGREERAEQKEREAKAERMTKEELEAAVLALFTKSRFWVLAQLTRKLGQPQGAVAEVVRDVANKHINGPHKGEWELKPEYRVN